MTGQPGAAAANALLLPAPPLLDLIGPSRTNRQAARICGVSIRTIQRWRAGSGIRPVTADLVATNLGYHPSEIWGYIYYP